MLKSMTGFGRAEQQNGAFSCKAEVRSVNNRFIDINTRLPKFLSQVELPVKNLVKSRCARGSFEVYVSIEKQEGLADQEIRANLDLARQYFQAYEEIKRHLNLPGEIDLAHFLGIREIVRQEPLEFDEEKEQMVLSTVGAAIDALVQMRREEGRNLAQDLQNRVREIAQWVDRIRKRHPEILRAYRDKLREKIKALSEGIELDETRLAQETAVLADRSDISEELIRLDSHLQQFDQLLQSTEPVGRKLEFVTQEINRETNTIGSKSIDYEISQAVIEIKSLLEKIREQLQNVE